MHNLNSQDRNKNQNNLNNNQCEIMIQMAEVGIESSPPRQRNHQNIKPSLKNKSDEDELLIVEACCSRHLRCIRHNNQNLMDQSSTFSIQSDLLKEVQPINIASFPENQNRQIPEIDLLVYTNLKYKKYQQKLKKYEEQIKEKQKKERLEKVREEAKQALSKTQRVKTAHKNKWGHSIFVEEKDNKEEEKKQENHNHKKQKQKQKQVQLKPIKQRIIQYKANERQKSLKKQECHKIDRHDEEIIKQSQNKIAENAQRILDQLKIEKQKQIQNKKIVQAKIRALQLKSKENVSQCKKKSIDDKVPFELCDSQYSTFEARKEGRKTIKKNKKKGNKPDIKTDKININNNNKTLKKPITTRQASSTAFKKKNKTQTLEINSNQEQFKNQQNEINLGKFYLWNMPIYPEDATKIIQNQNQIHLNVDRFNYKPKSFREEANEFLMNKLAKNMEEQKIKSKNRLFDDKVQQKKQQLLKQFSEEQFAVMKEQFWSEDQIFRHNPLQNFHFQPKNHLNC